ncbi:MAG: hypothetical protein HXY34_06005 [Candidatus Thorarchaeota archaeon]|nr:hypothetical protein [Candidatus Thorarchaeota archaeon]
MSFNIGEILEKLKAIEGFANNVAETKKLADELAMNLARMKEAINKTINDSFKEIADQIDQLRRTMETMEQVRTSAPAPTPAAPTPPPKSTAPTRTEPAPEIAVTTPSTAAARTPQPEPAPAVKTSPRTQAPPVTAVQAPAMDDELVVLLQKKDRLKASLTDLRFDYMRGYIPEPEYKSKEAELDSQLEELDKQIASKK